MPARAHAAMLVPALLFSGTLAFQRPGTTLLDTAAAIAVCFMHLLTAYLASAKRHNAAGLVAYSNWTLKFLYWSWFILPGAHTPWLGLASNYTVYGLGACSALMDFYQLQLGGRLHPALLAALSSCHAMCLAGFTLAVRHRSGMTTESWTSTCVMLIAGMVAGPRLADALLLSFIKHIKWTGRAHEREPRLQSTEGEGSVEDLRARRQQRSIGSVYVAAADKCSTSTVSATTIEQYCQPAMCGCAAHPSTPCMNHAPALFDSARSAVRLAQSQQYVSRMGVVAKVCVKVDTNHTISDVNPELASQLQVALANIGYPRHHLLDIATRPGCIALTLDVRQKTRDGDRSHANSAMIMHPAQHAQMVAAELLPSLKPLLSEAYTPHGKSAPITFTLGGIAIVACWQAGSWVIQAAPGSATPAGTLVHPSIVLAATQQLEGNSMPRNKLNWISATLSAVTNSSAACNFLPAALTTMQPGLLAEAHAVRVQVHMASDSATSASEAIGDARRVVGWQPAEAGMHEVVESSNNTYRLLARFEGSYLRTSVRLDEHADPGSRMLQVDINVPDGVLLRHHLAGPSVGLLPVTLELWHGLHHVTSTSLLLQVPSCTPAATPAVSLRTLAEPAVNTVAAASLGVSTGVVHVSGTNAGMQALAGSNPPTAAPAAARDAVAGDQPSICSQHTHGVWWWGTDGNVAAQAAQELQAHGCYLQEWAHLHNSSDILPAWTAWNAFMADVIIWLRHVRVASLAAGQCLSSDANSRAHKCTQMSDPALSPNTVVDLGLDLAAYAQSAGLRHVALMFLQQLEVACAWQQQAVSGSTSTYSPTCYNMQLSGTALLRGLKASVVGYACPMCELRCRDCMATQLASVQMYSSMAFSGMGAASIIRAWLHNGSNLIWLPWTLGHTMIWLRAWFAPRLACQPSPAQPANAHAQCHMVSSAARLSRRPCMRAAYTALTLLVMVCHVVPYLLNGMGWVPMSSAFRLLLQMRVVFVVSLVVSLGELLQLVAILPAPCVLAITSLDAACYVMVAAQEGMATPLLVVGLFASNVLSVLLMTVRLRTMTANTWLGKPQLPYARVGCAADLHAETAHSKASSLCDSTQRVKCD